MKRRTLKRERQKKNAFVVFHAPENVKRKCSNKKMQKSKSSRKYFFFFYQHRSNRSSIATISDIYCIIFLLCLERQNLKCGLLQKYEIFINYFLNLFVSIAVLRLNYTMKKFMPSINRCVVLNIQLLTFISISFLSKPIVVLGVVTQNDTLQGITILK